MKKLFITIVVLLALILLAGCTFQSAPLSAPLDTPRAMTAPPLVGSSPTATQPVSSVTTETDPEVVETAALTTSEEISPEVETTPSALEDLFAGVDPQGQRVFFWYFLPPQSPADQALNQVVDRFNQNNSHEIFIDAYNQSTASGVLTRTLPVLNTVDVPGVIMTNPDLVAQMDDGLQDLTVLYYSPRWGFSSDQQQNFSTEMLRQGQFQTYHEVLLSFPLLRQAEVLYSNMEWITELGFVRAPRSPQELQTLACLARDRGMRRADNGNPTGLHIDAGLGPLATFIQAFGGEFSGPDAATYEVNTPAATDALRYLQALASENCADLAPAAPDTYQPFLESNTALLLSSSAHMADIESGVDQGLDFAWDAAGFPGPEDTRVPVVTPGLSFSVPRSTNEQMLAAWLFIKFFHSPEAQAIWIPATGNLPLTVELALAADMPAAYNGVVNQIDRAFFIPALPRQTEIDELVVQAMQDVFAGIPPEVSLNQLQAGIDEVIADFYNLP